MQEIQESKKITALTPGRCFTDINTDREQICFVKNMQQKSMKAKTTVLTQGGCNRDRKQMDKFQIHESKRITLSTQGGCCSSQLHNQARGC